MSPYPSQSSGASGAPALPAGKTELAPSDSHSDVPLGSNYEITAPWLLRRLSRYQLQSISKSIIPEHRIFHCLRSRQPGRDVEVWKSKEKPEAHYRGLQVCGSVWVCPVCAAKISEPRRMDLQAAIASWTAKGGEVRHVVLTV